MPPGAALRARIPKATDSAEPFPRFQASRSAESAADRVSYRFEITQAVPLVRLEIGAFRPFVPRVHENETVFERLGDHCVDDLSEPECKAVGIRTLDYSGGPLVTRRVVPVDKGTRVRSHSAVRRHRDDSFPGGDGMR